ncbi:MAG: rRNA ((1915)-N(3))-methyltransferase RlmH [Alphaproteobacteria bacterium]|nr:rRNA ((1915)-N(3))-methyltransferase RlmH [Alphaproteobacteria bacterium]
MSVSIHLIAIGKNKDAELQRLIDDYTKRLSWKFTLTELPAPNVSDAERKMREAELIRAALPAKSVHIILDERGENVDSVAFAQKIQHYFTAQQSSLCFIIGGADGLDDTLRREADWRVSFGALTWPHMLVRLMLAEQLYRASTILSGHPYHRV